MNGGGAILAGVLLGAGTFCLWWSCWARPPRVSGVPGARRRSALQALGVDLPGGLPPAVLPLGCLLAAVLAGVLVAGTTGVLVLAALAAPAAAAAPVVLLRHRARRRLSERSPEWPDVADTLAASVRAGASLPDAVCALAVRGPEALRPEFDRFARGYRTSGAFDTELDALTAALADPTFDRLAATLRMTRQVGGSDLGGTLRTLSGFLREDQRTRGELLARQSWTVSSARLAAAAPWVVLALLGTRPGALAVYDSPQGAVVLAGGAVVTVVAYRVMARIGRLPQPRRVVR